MGADVLIPMLDAEGTDGTFGHGLRNQALDRIDRIRVAEGWIVSIDDDDIFEPHAFEIMRNAVVEHPEGRWFIFKMTFGEASHCPGVTVWQEQRIRQGNVGTPMILAPAHAKARWGTDPLPDLAGVERPGWLGDFVYAQRLQAELGEPVWVNKVIATVRPEAIESAA